MLASLLPHIWFTELPTAALGVVTIATMAAVIKGADWLVEGAAGMAKMLGMPEVLIGATIVSLGTTSPEAAVSVLAAWSGESGLALGNGVGSIIADTGLIFGVGCLMCALPADRFVLSRQGWVQFGSAVLLAALCYGLWFLQGDAAAIGRVFGLVFAGLLVGYMALSIKWARAHPYGEPHIVAEDGEVHEDHAPHAKRPWLILICLGLSGLAMVIFAGDALVQSVTTLAERWSVPDVVIASTLVALGTSLPELVVGITAIRKGHPELLVGNVIGADILNVLFVIGFAALAAPLNIVDSTASIPTMFIAVQIPTMLAMLILMRLYIFKATRVGHFSRWMGVPMVLMYVAFTVISLYLARA